MYVQVVLLHILLQTSTLCGSSRIKEYRTLGHYEESWKNDVEGVKVPKPSRRKRDLIDPSYFDEQWRPEKFYGVRSETIMSIVNKGTYPNFIERKYSYGVRVQSKLVLTLCSVVTYVTNPAEHVDAWVHVAHKFPLFKCKVEDITVIAMNSEKSTPNPVKEILIHPACTSWYDIDVAVIVLNAEIPNTKNVWIHSAENMVFRRNLDRVVAAQAVLGKCTVPIYKKTENPKDKSISYIVDYVKINFQHWDGCKANVCPYWGRGGRPIWHDPNRCANLLNGTRYCMGWTLPASLCGLSPGTPVFCDVGTIHGLMGFIANETYLCTQFYDKNAVMVGLVDSIGWIRDTLMLRYSYNYEKSLPQWMINLRENYTSNVRPRLKPLRTTTPGPLIRFDHFIGHQSLSIVNVFVQNEFKCRGTLVTHLVVILPCSCVTTNHFDMSTENSVKNPQWIEHADLTKLKVSMMVNGSLPSVRVTNMVPHLQCDNHYEKDHALILLDTILPGSKLAWVMTAHDQVFKNMLRVLPVADSSMGFDCYWMENKSPKDSYFIKHKIRFVHWTQCTYNVCPINLWTTYQKDRCYGPDKDHVVSNLTNFCVKSAVARDKPVCELASGTPIFCNVEEARGYVGFITKGMDLNPEPCVNRNPENQTAVFTGIDKFLPQFYDSLWMNEMEVIVRDFVRDNVGEQRSFSSTTAPSVVVIFVAFRIISIVFNRNK